MTFYLQRTVILVDYWDEFTFGLRQEPQRSIPGIDAFVARWRAHTAEGRKALAIVSEDAYAKLKGQGVAMRVVAQDTRRIVIANI
jgi:hypothetical protein